MAIIKRETFKRLTDDSLIVVPCSIGNNPLSLALDTGASHTTVDLTPMLMAGYEVSHAIRTEKIETASGIIDSHVLSSSRLQHLALRRKI